MKIKLVHMALTTTEVSKTTEGKQIIDLCQSDCAPNIVYHNNKNCNRMLLEEDGIRRVKIDDEECVSSM